MEYRLCLSPDSMAFVPFKSKFNPSKYSERFDLRIVWLVVDSLTFNWAAAGAATEGEAREVCMCASESVYMCEGSVTLVTVMDPQRA